MINRTSNGSVVVELILSVALIVGVGITAHAAQHSQSKDQAVSQALLTR